VKRVTEKLKLSTWRRSARKAELFGGSVPVRALLRTAANWGRARRIRALGEGCG